ncbi:MAG: hypothetical protein WAU75_07790, partial [Solirubrobacteraceae bacterium]
MLPAPHPLADGGRATSLIVWLAAFALLFGAFVVFAGSPAERKPHFWLRVASLPLVPALIAAILIAVRELRMLPDTVDASLLLTLVFLTIPGLMLVPALLYRRPGSSPDSSDDGGGGGSGPGPAPTPPTLPRDGVPLPDAEQARMRLREHGRRVSGAGRLRRPAREPERAPLRS